MQKIKIYRRSKDVQLPQRMTKGSAAYDIYCENDIDIPAQKIMMIDTGLIIQCPPGYHIKLFIRSSMALKYGLSLINNTGIIDEDYCGPEDFLKIAVIRHAEKDSEWLHIKRGERVAQIMFEKTAFPNIQWEEQSSPDYAGTNRGGFGSTLK